MGFKNNSTKRSKYAAFYDLLPTTSILTIIYRNLSFCEQKREAYTIIQIIITSLYLVTWLYILVVGFMWIIKYLTFKILENLLVDLQLTIVILVNLYKRLKLKHNIIRFFMRGIFIYFRFICVTKLIIFMFIYVCF